MQINLPSWIHPFRCKDTGQGGIPFWGWGLLGLTAFMLSWHWLKNEDLGFQLHAGKLIFENGDVPRQEPFLWTEPKGSYINLQWLWQLALYACWQAFGYSGLMVWNWVLQMTAFGVWLWRVDRLSGQSPALGSFALLLLFFLVQGWMIRPHSVSWIFLGLTLLVLEEHRRRSQVKLFLLPFLFVLWVNCHALFSLGLVVGMVWLAAEILEGLIRKFRGRENLHPCLPLLVWLGISVLACLLNPYGWSGFTFPLQQAGILAGRHEASHYIHEFQSFWEILFPASGLKSRLAWFEAPLAVVLILLIGAGLVRNRHFLSVPAAAVILVLGLATLKMGKNFGYFFILAGPYAAMGLDALVRKSGEGWQRWGLRAALAACLGLSVALPSGLWRRWMGQQPFGVGFDPRVHPEKVCLPLKNIRRGLRLLNGHDNGGWVAWVTGQKVFLDARNDHYSPELLVSYMESRYDPKKFLELLGKWRVNAVLARFDAEPVWVPTLMQMNRKWSQAAALGEAPQRPFWRCVARDHHSALFFRQDFAPGIGKWTEREAGHDFLKGRENQMDEMLEEMARKSPPGWRQAFLPVDIFPFDNNLLAARSLEFGELEEAKSYALDGMSQSPWFFASLWSNLAYAFEFQGDYRRADFCWETILKKSPEPRWSEQWTRIKRNRASRPMGGLEITPGPSSTE